MILFLEVTDRRDWRAGMSATSQWESDVTMDSKDDVSTCKPTDECINDFDQLILTPLRL